MRHVRIPLPLDHLHNLHHHCGGGGGGGGGGNRICCYGGGGHDVGPLVREPHAAAATATAGRPLQRRGGRPVGPARGHEHDGGQRRERRGGRRRRRGRRRLERGIGGGGGGRPRLFAQRYRKSSPLKRRRDWSPSHSSIELLPVWHHSIPNYCFHQERNLDSDVIRNCFPNGIMKFFHSFPLPFRLPCDREGCFRNCSRPFHPSIASICRILNGALRFPLFTSCVTAVGRKSSAQKGFSNRQKGL